MLKDDNLLTENSSKKISMHGKTVIDDYTWMRDDNWPEPIKDQNVISYLKKENKECSDYFKPLNNQREALFQEIKARIKLADKSAEIKDQDYYYYSRTEADKDYTIYCRRSFGKNTNEEILLNVNELAKGKKFTKLGAFSISPNHKLMAYSIDYTGGERYLVMVYDLEKKEYLEDKIPDTIGGIVWHEGINGFFYAPTNKEWRHDRVMFHKLGTKYEEDKLIVHEKDPLFLVSPNKTSSKKYILIENGGHDSNEQSLILMENDKLEPILINKREEEIHYDVDHGGKYFYKHTNKDAKNFKILRLHEDNMSNETQLWEEFIPEDSGRYLSSFDITKSYLILNYKKDGLTEIVVRDLISDKERIIDFPDESYSAGGYSTNFEEDDLRVSYSSLAKPSTCFSYDFKRNKLDILKEQEIPSGFDKDLYKVERIHAKSEDGTLVPISLFYKKDRFKKDGSNPLYLYGYGSYGIGMPPSFRNSAVSLVDRGFVYAIAHIRGGDDLGHDWYEAAKFLNKKRTFEDFIACSKHLIEQKYTNSGDIVIVGGSAGGMLVGNAINSHPELYKAVIAHVPFVDVLNTMLDETLPLTPGEFKEWGNPKEQEFFDYILSYSPYENVKKQNYPAIFATAGLYDPRVGYWEAAKWIAKIRDKRLNQNSIILKTNMNSGHAGASGRFDYLKEAADDLAFIFNEFKIDIELRLY